MTLLTTVPIGTHRSPTSTFGGRRAHGLRQLMLWLLATTLPLWSMTEADAATVFRCGDAYSDRPCPAATVLRGIDDRRSETERAAAADVASRQARLALQMTRDREQAEAQSTTSAARLTGQRRKAAVTASSTAAADGKSLRARTSRTAIRRRGYDSTDDFVAFVPKPPRQTAPKKTP